MVYRKKIFGLVLFLFLIVNSVMTGFTNNTDSDSSAKLFRTGISGEITSKPGFFNIYNNEEYVVLPTTTGLYIIKEGDIITFVPSMSGVYSYKVINDINNDGYLDIVIATADETFPNIRAISSKDGEELWTYSASLTMYNNQTGWFDYQPYIIDMQVLNEYEPGKNGIAVTSGYSVFFLEQKTGELIWEYKDKDNVWAIESISDINGNNTDDLVFGNQKGELKSIDGKTGELLWNKTVLDKYKVRLSDGKVAGEVYRSIWEIMISGNGENESIIISAGNGSVYKINPQNGEIEWEKTVFEYLDSMLLGIYGDSGPFYPVGISSNLFFCIRVVNAGDMTDDGTDDIIATTFLGPSLGSGGWKSYKDTRKQVYLLNGKTGEAVWDIKNINISSNGNPVIFENDENKYLMLAGGMNSKGESIIKINIKTGATENPETIKIGSNKTNYSQRSSYYLSVNSKEQLLFGSSANDLVLIDNELDKIVWNSARTTNSSFLVNNDDGLMLIKYGT